MCKSLTRPSRCLFLEVARHGRQMAAPAPPLCIADPKHNSSEHSAAKVGWRDFALSFSFLFSRSSERFLKSIASGEVLRSFIMLAVCSRDGAWREEEVFSERWGQAMACSSSSSHVQHRFSYISPQGSVSSPEYTPWREIRQLEWNNRPMQFTFWLVRRVLVGRGL